MLITILFLVGCSDGSNDNDDANNDNNSEKELDITLSTAASTGTYYSMEAEFAKIWNDNLSDINVSSQSSEGSVQNINLMAEGEVNAGFTSTGPLYSAYNGEEEFDGRAYKDVRVVAALYPNASHIIATEDSG